MWSLSECIPWMTVGLVASVAILTLNLCTLIVFIRNRNLRKRSTYLVINLAVIDMFLGGVNVPYNLFYINGTICNLWKEPGDRAYDLISILMVLFPSSSLINIAIIALERVHATFFPFRHRVLKQFVYQLMIAVVWVTSVLITVANILLVEFETFYHAVYLHATFFSICLLIICVSYMCIVVKFRCGAQPQHHGAASRERKLTMTLLIVTVVSLLLYLPYTVYWFAMSFSKFEIFSSLFSSVGSHIYSALLVLLYANFLVNPILYAIRLPEYRSAFLALFRGSQEQRQDAVFPLRGM